ncbi:MAG: hypothetical protein KC589_04830 [Nanoarchaeota archaeon]|nr:hypothetical protein [Nanoarchaeota archaeon]
MDKKLNNLLTENTAELSLIVVIIGVLISHLNIGKLILLIGVTIAIIAKYNDKNNKIAIASILIGTAAIVIPFLFLILK